jgi:hypothetical protein
MPTTPNVMSVNESELALGAIAASMFAFVSASMFRPKQIKSLVFLPVLRKNRQGRDG